ncbi:tyrosine-protein phosphatase non-receptor type 23-like [Uloborus diversus]|uniref:tyrosine-protein phosphatase non-receptor type 23-like n=1 Tax=Uloborus diversus TaxID=327109 RepID=UPI0024098CDF|nr:tyrosine-protein phosphatase non-receptor type 23-like [Uloborus diversus]
MEAVPRLPMLSCDLKISPSNTEFGSALKKYIRDYYHEDPESYAKEIKEFETLRLNAIKAPMDFTGCSILKRYYSQLHKLQSRFPMTDDGAACVPFMWTDIYSGVAYNITDIEYEEACILYNIGALHSKLGTMDSRCNPEGMKIACTHFQCAAWAFQHLRDTYPQPKGSDMSHDLLTFFINIMLAQAQECILEKSMLDSRKSSITAKIAAQVVDYYKCALGIMVSGSPSTDTGSILDIVGSKIFKSWKKFIEFKIAYYSSISHLYMGNQAEENEKWGERVSWFQSAFEHLSEAFKIAKGIDRDDLNEPLTFTMDVIGGKHNSSKKENEFVYHEKVPAISSLPELKGASLVKGIPFSITDPDVSGVDIFGRLVPMEAHEASSLYSEEKAKILRSVSERIKGKNEELMAYLSSLQLESSSSFDNEEKIPQELLEKCAALSVRPTAISDLSDLMAELLKASKDVETALKNSSVIISEEEQKELKHQETFGKRGPSMLIVELKKECSKYEEAHKKAVDSNNTLQAAVNIHLGNLTKLTASLEELAESLPSLASIKTPENVQIMEQFNHLIAKVDEMQKQRQYLEQQLRNALLADDITKRLVTMDKKEDLQHTFDEELKKHNEILTYLDQNLTAQDNILCALTEANAHYADTRKAIAEVKHRRNDMVKSLISSFDAYDDLVAKAKTGLEFYKKLQENVSRLFTRVRSVTKVQDEERSQITEAELRKGSRVSTLPNMPPTEQHVPKLKDYLPYMTNRGVPPGVASFNNYIPTSQPAAATGQYTSQPIRQATLGGPVAPDPNRNFKPGENFRTEENIDTTSIGVRPAPVGSEQTAVPAMCSASFNAAQSVRVANFSIPPQLPASATSGTPVGQVFASNVANQYTKPPNLSNIPVSQVMSDATYTHSKDSYNSVLPFSRSSDSILYQGKNYMVPQPANFAAVPFSGAPVMPNSYGSMPHFNAYSATTSTGSPQIGHATPFPMSNSTTYLNSSTSPAAIAPMQSYSNSAVTNMRKAPPIQRVPSGTTFPDSVPTMQFPATTSAQLFDSRNHHFYSSPGNTNGYQPAAISSVVPASVPSSAMPTFNSVSSPSATNAQIQPTVPLSMQQNRFPSNYNMPISSYGPNINSGYNYYGTPYQSNQNYQSSGIAIQGAQTSVTPSIDTRTSVLNSTNPSVPGTLNYPVPQQQNVNANYYTNMSEKTLTSSAPVPSLSCQNFTSFSQASNINSPVIQPSSFPAYGPTVPPQSYQYDGKNTTTTYSFNSAAYNVYNSQSNCIPNNNIGAVSHTSGIAGIQQVSTQSPAMNMQSGSTVQSGGHHAGQENFHITGESISQQNYSTANSVYNSSFPIPSQHLPAPMEPKLAVPSPPLQTEQVGSVPNQANEQVPIIDQKPKAPQEAVANAVRDLITPPPEPESVKNQFKESVEESTQVLQPKVIDLTSITLLKEKELSHQMKDPLDDSSVRAKFVSEVEKYEKVVDGLVRKSLNGTTPLDQKWKEFIDAQDKVSRKMSISVARCCPLKNRFPDVMPYDCNRVKLTTAKDDYINASYLKDICPNSPIFILTQAPLPSTFNDFWLMVWEQQVETLVCLLSDLELKNHVYFPKERGQVLTYGTYEISLHSNKEKNGFIERMINITHIKNRTSRVVVHLQFSLWPVSGVPSSAAPFLQFTSDVLSYYKQQRNLLRPVVVHCSAGIGRSGCFCLVMSLVSEMNNGHGPRDVGQVASTISQQRKFLLQDKDHLKFCYDTVLYYAQDLLMRRGILTTRATFEDKLPSSGTTSSHVRHPSEDFILGTGGLAKLQSGIAKMGITPDQTNSDSTSVDKETFPKSPVSLGNGNVAGDSSSIDKLDVNVDKPAPVNDTDSKIESTPTEESKSRELSGDKNVLPSITSLLDPSNFTLESTTSPAKRKITKENFISSKGSLSTSSSDSADPLSQLDPLWSLKK